MSEEQLKAFLEAVKNDAGLQEQLNGGAGDAEAVVAIAKAAGFVITAEDAERMLSKDRLTLTDEELESAAGGYLSHTCSLKIDRCN